MKNTAILFISLFTLFSCKTAKEEIKPQTPFVWKSANLYFLMVDRFNNGDTTNDLNFNRTKETGVLRGFEGGDLRGIIQKIDENYFTDLGINAIWMTPIVQQIEGSVDEGVGNMYGFHGYWAKDWTAIDPNFGTKEDLAELVKKAHAKGIRIVLDAVINHTGPVTESDPVWPSDWVRTSPKCSYDTYVNCIECTLVENLPDVKTESNETVELPPFLVEKWKNEGRYDEEISELDAFFTKTGYPRAPKYYIMKWLADYITDYGIDGYRVDTVKHTTEDVWADFNTVCQSTFEAYKTKNPNEAQKDQAFFMLGEVYGYGLHGKQIYDFGDKKVDYFVNGFSSLINFDFKSDANKSYEELFSYYATTLQTDLKGKTIMNYVSSHDDGQPFDVERKRAKEAGTKLLLTSGISQLYYGDETARPLQVEGALGDANLRTMMNWESVKTSSVLPHYQKLGQFRANHPAIGAGVHKQLLAVPYVFSRTYVSKDFKDEVVVALDLPLGEKSINVKSVFEDGTLLRDAYSKTDLEVKNGQVTVNSPFDIILLEKQ